MSIGPREFAARQLLPNPPYTDAERRRILWAKIQDDWSMAHHNLHRATRSATRSLERLGETLRRIAEEGER